MGRKTQAFKVRLTPVAETIPDEPQRALTWPLPKPCTPLVTPPTTPELSVVTEGYQSPLLLNFGEIKCAVSVGDDGASFAGKTAATCVICDDGEEGSGSEWESWVEEDGTRRQRRHRGRRGKEWVAPAAPNHFVDRPCEHNSWDNVRVKKDRVTLRCRICQLQWKVDHVNLREGAKCQEFHAHGKCSKGDRCPKIHIYRCKQNLSKRKAIWGDDLLVPHAVPPSLPAPLSVAGTGFEPRQDTGASDTYSLATPQGATPHASSRPIRSLAFRRQSCTSTGGSTPTNTTSGQQQVYTHNPYEPLTSPTSSSLPDPTLVNSTSSAMWTAGPSCSSPPSRRGSEWYGMDSRRTSTGSGSIAPSPYQQGCLYGAAERYSGPSSRSVGAPVEGVCIYPFRMTPYGFPPIPPSAAEWVGAPIPSPSCENRHFGIESHASTGTLPVPRQISSVCPTRRGSCPGAKHRSPQGVQSATKSSSEPLSPSCTWVGSISDDESDEEVSL